MKTISSRQNAAVQTFRALHETPDPEGVRVLLDGAHLVREAWTSGTTLEVVAVAASRLQTDSEEGRLAGDLERGGVEVIAAPEQVLAAMSPVRTPSGIVALGRRRPVSPAGICSAERAFVVAAVDVQDPGNVGSLIRVAEAGGATGALVCGASANPFSWKAVRGSMGSALRLPVAGGLQAGDALACLGKGRVRTVAAVARGGLAPDAVDWTGRVALLLGAEGRGLDEAVVAACDGRVTIPMTPPVESLNVAAAGAILIYAARRQRG